jgi:hypothetical protein
VGQFESRSPERPIDRPANVNLCYSLVSPISGG